MTRCDWAATDALYMKYHDTEWGTPLHDDIKLFEFLILEGVQAGLSWITVLKKRDNYRKSMSQFNPYAIASYGAKEVNRLMSDSGIIKNRLKIEASIRNARAVLEVIDQYGSFETFLWDRFDGQPIVNQYKSVAEIPAYTVDSENLSKELKKRNFSFVGPTIVYSFMQAAGFVNDHITTCFRHKELK